MRFKTVIAVLVVLLAAGAVSAQTLDEVRRMQANVRADTIYYWGQELTIHTETEKLREQCDEAAETEQLIRRCVTETIALPLLIPENIDYAAMIEKVVRQRRARFPSGSGSDHA